MGRRGPKPVHIGNLHAWEFEWYKALHFLREGTQLPEPPRPALTPDDVKRIDAGISELRAMPISRIVGADPPPSDYQPTSAGDPSPLAVWLPWAEGVRQQKIADLIAMKPREIQKRAERRDIWQSLWQSRSAVSLNRACDRWESLEDVIGLGFTAFPHHVRANARSFLALTGDTRFPRSVAADDSRLNYLARGMAGVLEGVSPMTGVERLRNMSHKQGGLFWDEATGVCRCWRCCFDL